MLDVLCWTGRWWGGKGTKTSKIQKCLNGKNEEKNSEKEREEGWKWDKQKKKFWLVEQWQADILVKLAFHSNQLNCTQKGNVLASFLFATKDVCTKQSEKEKVKRPQQINTKLWMVKIPNGKISLVCKSNYKVQFELVCILCKSKAYLFSRFFFSFRKVLCLFPLFSHLFSPFLFKVK